MRTRPLSSSNRQRGAAMMVMLVIMVLGAAAFLVSTLSSSVLQIARQDKTSEALAQAKEALIGRAVSDENRPGSLPCPDILTNNPGSNVPNDGVADMLNGNDCPSYIGRLPWRTLGLPDLRDGSGERLWYALSRNFRDDNSNPINSDSAGTLTVSGTTAANNVIAIVFAPGTNLSGKSRSDTQTAACATTGNPVPVAESWCATNYLEGTNANLNTLAALNLNFQSAAVSETFNDQLITLSHDQIFTPVEMRVAREAKACLDSYAVTSANRYPWAAPVNSVYVGQQSNLFGRISDVPNVDTPGSGTPLNSGNDPNYDTVNTAILNLGTAIANCGPSDNTANKNALNNTALTLSNVIGTLPNPPYTAAFVATANALVVLATSPINPNSSNACWKIENNHDPAFIASINASFAATQTALNNLTTAPSGMSALWPNGCFGSAVGSGNNQYWNNWRELVFYQVDDLYKPDAAALVTPFPIPSISISGTGSFRAVVLVARQPIPVGGVMQVRSFADAATYLEGLNFHSGAIPATTFETYKPSDASYTNVNDLVLCLDGNNNCK